MSSRFKVVLFTVIAATLLRASIGEAQVFTPSYMAPRSSSDLGVYLSDGPGDFAIEGIWRTSQGGYDFGFRGGLADLNDIGILLGVDLRNPFTADAPLDFALTGAAQGLINTDGDSGIGFAGGVTLGHTFNVDEIAMTPYLHPRVALIAGFGDDDLDLDLLADFGFDVRFNSNLELRFGFAFADHGGDWGVGLAWR